MTHFLSALWHEGKYYTYQLPVAQVSILQ